QVVEQVHKEEDKDDLQQPLAESAGNIEFKGGVGERVEASGGGRPVGQAQGPGGAGDGQYADQDGAADFPRFKSHHEDEAGEGQNRGGIADVAQGDQGLRVAHHQAGVAEADEGDEKPDAAGHGGVELVGDGAQDHP